jgi:hypothetical protein
MGREIVYCSQCGVRILEKDLSTGRAFTVLDKVFCAECRDQAFKQGPGPEPAPAARAPAARPSPQAPVERKASGAAPRVAAPARPRPGAPPVRPEGVSSPRPVVRKANNRPVVIGSAVGLLAIVVVIMVILLRGQGKPTPDPGTTDPKKRDEAIEAKLTPEQRAAKRLDELLTFAASQSDPKAVLKRANEVEKDILSTPSETPYKAFRKKIERQISEAESGKKIDAMLAEAKSIFAADKEFKRYAEIRELLQKAEQLALEEAPDKVADVKNLRKEIEEPFEAAADKWYEEQGDRIRTFMREGDHKAALKVLDRFPEHLKLSKVYRVNITRLREECEREIARKAGQEVKDWKKDLRIATEELGFKNYKKAREGFANAERNLPSADKLTEDEKRAVAWSLYYNWACSFAEESKKLEGAEKAKFVDSAFEYLGKSAERGVFGYRCGERDHATAKDHWDADKDLETIRSDPRYAAIIQKYNK